MEIFERLIDPKTLKILKVLSQNSSQHFNIQKLSYDSKVPIATTFRIVKKLLKEGVVGQIMIHKTKLYKLKNTKELERLLR